MAYEVGNSAESESAGSVVQLEVPKVEVVQGSGDDGEVLEKLDELEKLLQEEQTRTVEVQGDVDYTQQIDDLATLLSYQTVLILVLLTMMFLMVGVNVGSFFFGWLKGR